MLPTPSRDDAVSVSYKPENAYLKRTFTSPSMLTHQRTLLCRWHTSRPKAASRFHSAVRLPRRWIIHSARRICRS